MLLKTTKSNLTVGLKSFSENSSLPVVFVPSARPIIGVVKNSLAQAKVVTVVNNCGQGIGQSSKNLIAGPSLINLNQPAQCFSLNASKNLVVEKFNLKVLSVATQAKVVVVPPASVFIKNTIGQNPQNIPALPVSVLAVIALWKFGKKKVSIAENGLRESKLSFGRYNNTMEILRC